MSERWQWKANGAYTTIFRVLDSSNSPVTGLINTDFTKLLFKDGSSNAQTVTITEISNGFYKAVYTPNANGYWTLLVTNATYNTAGWQDDIQVYDFDFSDLNHRTFNGSVNDGSPSSTGFVTAFTDTATDQYKGFILIFTSGTLKGQYRWVKTYNGSTKAVTFDAFPSAPANSDTFDLVPAQDPDLIAKRVLVKQSTDIEAEMGANYQCLGGVIATETQKRVITGSTLSIKKHDNSTELYNATLTTTATQLPITTVSPN